MDIETLDALPPILLSPRLEMDVEFSNPYLTLRRRALSLRSTGVARVRRVIGIWMGSAAIARM